MQKGVKDAFMCAACGKNGLPHRDAMERVVCTSCRQVISAENASQLVEYGLALRRRGRLSRASECFELAAAADNLEGLFWQAMACYQGEEVFGSVQRAENLFKQVIERAPLGTDVVRRAAVWLLYMRKRGEGSHPYSKNYLSELISRCKPAPILAPSMVTKVERSKPAKEPSKIKGGKTEVKKIDKNQRAINTLNQSITEIDVQYREKSNEEAKLTQQMEAIIADALQAKRSMDIEMYRAQHNELEEQCKHIQDLAGSLLKKRKNLVRTRDAIAKRDNLKWLNTLGNNASAEEIARTYADERARKEIIDAEYDDIGELYESNAKQAAESMRTEPVDDAFTRALAAGKHEDDVQKQRDIAEQRAEAADEFTRRLTSGT